MSQPREPISLTELAHSISVPWDARDIVTANDSVFRVLRVEGVMDWHHHEEDQLFLCWEGSFSIELAGRALVELHAGDIYVVPRGIAHKTSTDRVAYAIMSIGIHTMARR